MLYKEIEKVLGEPARKLKADERQIIDFCCFTNFGIAKTSTMTYGNKSNSWIGDVVCMWF